MRLSYCVPAHRRTASLTLTLPSVIAAANASPPVELVIVDYASQDGLLNLLASVRPTLHVPNRWQIVSYRGRPHYHMAHARNLSIRQASGTYLVLSCAECRLEPVFFAGLRTRVAETGATWLLPTGNRWQGVVVCRREELVAAGGYDERVEFYGPEDKELNARLERRAGPAAFYPHQWLVDLPHRNKTAHYRLPLSKREMHHEGRSYLLDAAARHALVANEGIAWGQLTS